MAEDHLAQNHESRWPVAKIFTAFRVALDLKKLLLAAGGMLATAAGWWILATIFYGPTRIPEWKDYSPTENKSDESIKAAFHNFKRDRTRWNLLHEMAGPAGAAYAVSKDAADVAATYEEFELLDRWKKAYETGEKTLVQIETEGVAQPALLVKFKRDLMNPAAKPAGRLRTWPWFEERGPNQYLVAEGLLRPDAEGHRTVPWARGQFFGWFFSEQLPYLIEPLTKFLAPIAYFFHSDAGGFTMRLYLILVILWMLAVWGFFGGAICRIAAVQVARNEKISMRDALGFAQEKCLNLFTAPLFPLVFLGILTFLLALFGLVEGFTFAFGDIVLDGFLWPIVIVLGLIMAVVVVGLVGWPLMYPTIAAEGSDNFDALSRSYSYVYQAFWHYLGYWAVALAYGAALVFFVGFMGSLVVYMGKWGMSRAPGLQSSEAKNDRDPAYLFLYAPTSFGWRDLLIKDNLHVEGRETITPGGGLVKSYDFNEEYYQNLSWPNRIGAGLVAIWIWLFFLLIVGFGYSFFWTASTIIYFLMRRYVDDTEWEEVYYEEGELEPPGLSPASPAAPAAKPNTVSLNVVEAGAPAAAVISPGAPAPEVAPTASTEPPPTTPPPPAAP